MKLSACSIRYFVRQLCEDDLGAIYELCQSNAEFYEHCPPFVTFDSIRHDLHKLPPNKTMDDKYYLGFFDKENLVAVMDLIDGFPNEAAVFLGFFMVDAAVQNQGIGSLILRELCSHLRGQHYTEIRLGWVKGNRRSEAFWKKNGFIETGVTYDTDGYTVVVAHRML